MWKIDDFMPIYQRFLESGKSVREFCSDEGIMEGRFYHWQPKVRLEAAKGSGEFLPVSINKRGGKVAIMGSNGFIGGNGGGLVIYNLKLERGYIHLPTMTGWEDSQAIETAWSDLVMMVEGIYPITCKRSKRWSPNNSK